ncbi:SulP family inorganic anion transporter [Sorangium sp. So ce426]|uniref:SulP family inorganic anion transporter n=1 Tax=Sorangium sp. So ce426 TaxID=3133312 RepID=UPI003F5B4127
MSTRDRLLGRLKQTPYLSAILRGIVVGALVVTFDVSLAALFSTGDPGHRLPAGVGIFLMSSVVTGLIVALGSSFRSTIAAPQHSTGVVLASMAAGIAAAMAKIDPAADPFPTIVAAVAVSSFATGALLLCMGLLRLGVLVRFIPYPVMIGLFAGVAWRAVQGSIAIMANSSAGLHDPPGLVQPQALATILPGLFLGVLMTALRRRFTHFLLLPAAIAGAIGVFYAVLRAIGVTVERAREMQLLLGASSTGNLWPPMGIHDIAQVNWSVLAQNSGNIATITMMAVMTLLLGALGVERETAQEIDLNGELRATGIANLLASAAGSAPGHLAMAESTMNYKAGANQRIAGLTAAAFTALVMIFGGHALTYFPRPVLGGLVTFLGLRFLLDAVSLSRRWFRLRPPDYIVVIVILLVVASRGFLHGAAVGLATSFAFFALGYSRVVVVRNAVSCAALRSQVVRSDEEEMSLMERGDQGRVLQLQGYIFFGNAHPMLVDARHHLQSTDSQKTRYLLIDFRFVYALDSSAIDTFQELRRLAAANGGKIILTEVPTFIREYFERADVVLNNDDVCRIFPDLDRGLEAFENEVLLGAPPAALPPPMLFYDLQDAFNGRQEMIRFLSYLERTEIPEGHDLFRLGDASEHLYLIESGQLTAWLEVDGRKVKRLRMMGPGSVVGESDFFTGIKRSETVASKTHATLYQLSEEGLRRLTAEAPELAAMFHRFVIARGKQRNDSPAKQLAGPKVDGSHRRSDHRYRAFISYKHQQSSVFVERVESALSSYAKPLLQPPMRIFRDERHLRPGVDLPALIRSALESSEFLILLASPQSAASPWVNDEIDIWCRELGRASNLIVVLTGGTISIDAHAKAIDWNATDSLPAVLRHHLTTTPLFVDMTWARDEDLSLQHPRFKKQVNQIAARLRNFDPDEMLGAEMRTHQRNQRLKNAAITMIAGLVVALGVNAMYARRRQQETERALQEADNQRQEAQRRCLVQESH